MEREDRETSIILDDFAKKFEEIIMELGKHIESLEDLLAKLFKQLFHCNSIEKPFSYKFGYLSQSIENLGEDLQTLYRIQKRKPFSKELDKVLEILREGRKE